MKPKKLFNRALSCLLVLCMIAGILPVMAFAGEEGADAKEVLPNYFVDSFDDGRYVNGSLYKWATRESQAAERTITADGFLNVKNTHSQQSDKNNAVTYLTAADASVDYAETWTDYSVETRAKFTGSALTTQTKMGLMGRVQVADDGTISYYYAFLRNGNANLFLYKGTISADGVQTLTAIKSLGLGVKTEADKEYTLKMTFAGDQIKVYVDGAEKISVTDASYASGSVGLQITRTGDVQFDYIKVIHDDGSTVFKDDFTDTRYIDGVQYQWNPDAADTWALADDVYCAAAQAAPNPTAITAKWVTNTSNKTTRAVADGAFTCTSASGASGRDFAYLSLTDAASTDYAQSMQDYTVEADITLTGTRSFAYLGGRMQNTAKLNGYAVQLSTSNAWLQVFEYVDGVGTAVGDSVNVGKCTEGQVYQLKVNFTGNVITVYLNGEQKLQVTDADNTYTSGAPGLVTYQQSAGAGMTVKYDNVKVTNGTTLFEDTFADESTMIGKSGYLANGGFSATIPSAGASSSLVSMSNGTTNYAATWDDYAMESDFLLEKDDSAAGYIIRANGSSYYELRITKDKVALYQSGNQELASNAVTTAVGSWQFAKLEAEGTVIRGYVNGILVLTYDTANDEGKCTAGAPGLKTAGAAKYDNFAVYALEVGDARKTGTYEFKVSDISKLSANWVIGEGWTLADGKLVSGAASGVSTAVLKSKTAATDYKAEAVASAPAGGSFSVIGRYAIDGSAYYTLTANIAGALVLTKTVGSDTTTLATVSYDDMYLAGIRLQSDKLHALRIQMYGNVVEGYVDGIRVIKYIDDNPLSAGVSGIQGTAGVAFESLTIGNVDAVVKLTILDAQNNPVATSEDPVEVPLGKVPDIKHTLLKVDYYDGYTETIMMDTADVEAFDGSQLGAKTAKVAYLGAETVFHYTVIDRSGAIAQLESELAALNASAITLADEAAVKALAERYNDLSYVEKANITADSKQKIAAAQEAIELLKYPELKDTNIVFKDEFDTAASRGHYNNSNATMTWRRNSGNWYVENGSMVQYMTTTIGKPTQFDFGAILVDENNNPENFEIRSVSVDVQFIDEKAWAGIDFCFGGSSNERYCFWVTDKSNRIRLVKSQTIITTINADLVEDPITFAPGQWYNLRVTLDGNGLIKCYVDDRLWIEWQDVPDVQNDQILTHGSVGLSGAENYVKFDNLVVRGMDLPYDYPDKVTTNPNLEAGAYFDDFNDETTGNSPSHWIELNTEDKWLIKEDGSNKVYASKDNTLGNSHTWLHVFETDVDYVAKIRVTEKGYFPVVGLTTRVNADESWIKGGYDFTLKKWFVKVRLGADFAPVITYAENVDTAVDFTGFVTLRMKLVGKTVELYANGQLVVTADAGTKVMPGRVGVFTEQCNVDVDDIALALLSGQGRVNDGVLEYYTNTGSSFHSILEMWDDQGNQILLLYEDGTQSISTDGGQTFTRSTIYNNAGFKGNGSLELHDGSYVNIKRRGGSDPATLNDRVVYISADGGKSWPEVTIIPTDPNHTYSQPAEHINEVQLNDGTWRVFYTLVNQELGCSFAYYSDDGGYTWKESENTPLDFSNINGWNESYVIKISKDTIDASGKLIKAGTLIQYSSHNKADSMRYSLSYDGGVTWEGDYALPQIPCGDNSCCIKEDPYEPGTYYMTAPYNITVGLGYHHPRFRVVLLRSYDGLNWEFLADVDRWGDISDGNRGNIMQQVNAYICITEDYVFPIFSRSDQYLNSGSHNLQIGRMYRFDKDKLDAYDVWPQEYVIPDKAITSIEVVPGKAEVTLNDSAPFAGSKIKLNYYNTEPEYVDLTDSMDLTKNTDQPRAFATLPDTSTVGEKIIVVDYRHFRTIYTVNVVLGDAPVLSVEDGKTYCGEQEVTVNDANGDLASVTLNGEAVELADGKFTVSAAEGEQTIVATDKAGNVTTIKITVNEGHKGGTATCKDKAVCEVCGEAYGELLAHQGGTATCKDKAVCTACGEAYGELDAENHTGEAKWSHTDDKHSKAYDCCGKVVVEEEAHKLTDGKCECGYEAPASGDNSQTGDNSHIVLFGGLLALSVLAAGALLIPDIRKKLLNK